VTLAVDVHHDQLVFSTDRRLSQSYIRVVTAVQCVQQKMATQNLSGAKGVVKAVE
jgi:hypothetical protein